MNLVYIALGSNLGNRTFNHFSALNSLNKKIGKVLKTSQLYFSPTVDFNGKYVRDQNYFINSVVKLQTNLKPIELLKECKLIESVYI